MVDVWKLLPTYGSQQSQGQQKSVKLKKRERWMCRGFAQAVRYVAVQETRGEQIVSVRVYLGIATLSDRLHLQLRDSTFSTYTYAACRLPLRLALHLSVRRSTGSTCPEDSTNRRMLLSVSPSTCVRARLRDHPTPLALLG